MRSEKTSARSEVAAERYLCQDRSWKMEVRSCKEENSKFTHFDDKGKIQMVDITRKTQTERTAKAIGKILLKKSTIKLIEKNKISKGDTLTTAKLAGILAAKKVAELIPLTHPINITHCDLQLKIKTDEIEITSEVKTKGLTGPDIEALTAVAVAALTIYDMVKSVDWTATISDIHLVEKTGGKLKPCD